MTERLPQISGKKLCKALIRLGFIFAGERGSHIKLIRTHKTVKEIVIVPDHAVVRKGTLSAILKKVNISTNELKKLL